MAIGNALGNSGGRFYSFGSKPVLIDLSFTVDSTNSNGLGVSSVRGQGVKNVYMNTSATPAAGNPNPAAGVVWIQLQANYYRYMGGFPGAPTTGSPLAVDATALTVGAPYTIASLGSGTTVAADWLTLGVPTGVTPAVGVSFIAKVTGTGSGDATVLAPGTTGIQNIEVIGDPNLSLSPTPTAGLSPNVGGWIMLQFLNSSGTKTAPANLSVMRMSFFVDAGQSPSNTNKLAGT
jgi:hypothetical protein